MEKWKPFGVEFLTVYTAEAHAEDHSPGDGCSDSHCLLSEARESDEGGFGRGFTIAKAIAEGHDGELILKSNDPTGLIVRIRLPATSS